MCLTDQALASVLWLKGPTAAPDLPRNLLVSNALAAMQPSNDFWKRYLAEIARLETDDKITETDYDILRYSITAKRAVMDLTRGDIDAFTEGTIDEVLRRAEANVRADLELELADETERRNRLEEDLAALREEIRGRDRRGALRAQIQRERTALTARDIARRLMYVPRFGLRLLLVAGVVLTFPWDFPGLSAAWVPYLISGVLAVFLALQLVDAGFGLSLKDLMGRLEGGLAGWLEEKMTWLRPLEEDDPALGARDALLPSANVLTALPPPATHTAQQDVEG